VNGIDSPDAHAARTERTRAVVQSYIAALQQGDHRSLRACLAADATWWLRGDLPVSGTWTGPEQILDEFLAAMVATLDPTYPLRQVLKGIVADGSIAVAEWTSHARSAAGEPYVNDYAVVFEVRDDRITAVREYFDTAYAQRVLFANASQAAVGQSPRGPVVAPVAGR
jgi:ketosteroid isomerase-like protein